MSAPKFTPGPWHTGSDNGWPDMVFDVGGLLVATCPTPAEGSRGANARLIAAAPELYEALEHLLNLSAPFAWRSEQDMDKARASARAALAKARGEA